MAKGKGKAPLVNPALVHDLADPLRDLPPVLRELLEKIEPVFGDARFDV